MSDPFNLKETFITGPILLEKEAESVVEVDLSKDQFDVVSNKEHVVKATREQLQELYGDLPEELWEERAQVEQHFMAATPDQKHTDNQSHALPDARRCFLVGVSGKVGFAFQCADVGKGTEPEEEEGGLSALAKITKENASYAKVNPAYAFKSACNTFEVNAFYHRASYDIDHLTTQSSANLKMHEFQALGLVDPQLVPAVKRAGPLLTEKLRSLPKDAPLKPQRSKVRPGGRFATMEYYECVVQDHLTDRPESSKKTMFRLLTCRVPRPHEKKTPFWKDRSCVIECVAGTIPAACINEKDQLAVLYQPPFRLPADKRGLLRLDVFQVEGEAGNKIKRVQRLEFYFPAMFSPEGMMCTSLSDENVFAVSFSSGAMVIDLNKVDDGFSVMWLTMDDLTEDEKKKISIPTAALVRHVTCVRVMPNHVLLMGTDKVRRPLFETIHLTFPPP